MKFLTHLHARFTRRLVLALIGAAALHRPPSALAEYDGT